MLILNSLGIAAVIAMLVYIICFLGKYKVIPQSLSVTAEWSGRYYWWQITICTVMGFLGYWIATTYPFYDSVLNSFKINDTCTFFKLKYGYELLTMLGCAGAAGLGLAGYYSYTPRYESRRHIFIHKVGSFTGACLIVLFYILKSIFYADEFVSWIFCSIILAVSLLLGIFIKGKRLIGQTEIDDFFNEKTMLVDNVYKRYNESNSVVFWMELGIMTIISADIINKFINSI